MSKGAQTWFETDWNHDMEAFDYQTIVSMKTR
jgi:hypothetical protein